MTWKIVHGDARNLDIEDGSVDLICTSPPYWGLRSYRDAGEHYDGQIGSEVTPAQYVEELVGMVDGEWRRVLKGTGNLFLNLGDRHNNRAITRSSSHQSGLFPERKDDTIGTDWADLTKQGRTRLTDSMTREKSLLGLPWRIALALIDRGWILRAEIVWSKPNGLPESVTDRVRRSHEQVFHFTLEPRYYAAVDRIRDPYQTALDREPPIGGTARRDGAEAGANDPRYMGNEPARSGLGRLPGSVWTIPTVPLIVPDTHRKHWDLPDHFAAYPPELVRRIVLGWSPERVCVKCGEGRRPVSDITRENRSNQALAGNPPPSTEWANDQVRADHDIRSGPSTVRRIIGEVCACTPRTSLRGKRGDWKQGRVEVQEKGDDWAQSTIGPKVPRRKPDLVTQKEWQYDLEGWEPAPTVPGMVLDPMCGTGTTVGVAHKLGRDAVGVDLSADYCRLARWRIRHSGGFDQIEDRTWQERQETLL